MYRFYLPQLTLVRVLLAQDTTKSREHAAVLLEQLYEFVMFKKTLESHLREAQRQQPILILFSIT